MFFSMFAFGINVLNASCTLSVSPNNNAWCAIDGLDPEGNPIDYICQDEAAPPEGAPQSANCRIIISED